MVHSRVNYTVSNGFTDNVLGIFFRVQVQLQANVLQRDTRVRDGERTEPLRAIVAKPIRLSTEQALAERCETSGGVNDDFPVREILNEIGHEATCPTEARQVPGAHDFSDNLLLELSWEKKEGAGRLAGAGWGRRA